MRTVTLVSLSVEHFRSFSGYVEVEFPNAPGLYHLTGRNEVSPSLGANGVGKSGLLDAVFWALYGTSLRGQRAADLKSWGSEGRPRVRVVLSMRTGALVQGVTVERLGSPERITLNGKAAQQEDIDLVLGLSRAAFRQAVMFGQFAPHFVDLSAAERGALLEEVLSLEHWQKASDHAKKRASMLQEQIAELCAVQSRLTGKLEGLPRIKELRAQEAEHEAKAEERAQAQRARLSEEVDELARMQLRELGLEQQLGSLVSPDARPRQPLEDAVRAATREEAEMRSALRQTEKELASLSGDTSCPTCGRPWEDHKEREKKRQRLLARARIQEEKIQELSARTEKAGKLLHDFNRDEKELTRDWHAAKEELRQLAANIKRQQQRVRELRAAVEGFEKEANPFAQMIAETKQQRAEIKEELLGIAESVDTAKRSLERASFWQEGFKRVRLFEIGRITAHLENEITAALSSLGLPRWRVQVLTQSETKSGSLRHGVQLSIGNPERQTAPWESWSGGEGQRIRLAVTMGVSQLIQNSAGVCWTCEWWDEPSSWLSEQGVHGLLEVLEQRARQRQIALWVVDHRTMGAFPFAQVWTVVKGEEGSRVES